MTKKKDVEIVQRTWKERVECHEAGISEDGVVRAGDQVTNLIVSDHSPEHRIAIADLL